MLHRDWPDYLGCWDCRAHPAWDWRDFLDRDYRDSLAHPLGFRKPGILRPRKCRLEIWVRILRQRHHLPRFRYLMHCRAADGQRASVAEESLCRWRDFRPVFEVAD